MKDVSNESTDKTYWGKKDYNKKIPGFYKVKKADNGTFRGWDYDCRIYYNRYYFPYCKQ